MTRRPPNVPKEASGGAGNQWVLFRGDEMFLWTVNTEKDGVLVEHKQGDFETRYDIHGRLASRGRWGQLPDGRSRRPHGEWEYGPEDGAVRRRSSWELGVERARTWLQHGLERSGAIAQIATALHPIDVEVGTWTVRDASGAILQTVELGRAFSDDELLAHPAMAEAPVDAEALTALAGSAPVDAPSLCAWIRLAARVDTALLARIPVRPERWAFIPHSFPYWHDGAVEPLLGGTLAARLQAVLWGSPWEEVLDAAATWLVEKGHPQAALDFVDAVTGLRGVVPHARAACLVALGRDAEAVLPAALTADEATAHARLPAREAAAALADLIAGERGGPTALASAARIRLLRAYAAETTPPARALAAFVASIPEPLRRYREPSDFTAGFSDAGAISVEAEEFLAHPEDIARLFPCAVELDLMYASGAIARLATCPAIARYRRLRFSDTYLFQGRAAQLAGSRFLARLEELGLYGTSLYDDDLVAILESPHLRALRALDLGNPREDQHYTLEGLRAITRSLFAHQLTSLSISRRYFGPEVVPDVIARLPRLEDLDLEAASLERAGTVALAALPHRFTSLNLQRCGIDAVAMRALAASPVLSRCTSLDLGGNPLGAGGLVALARSPHLGNLTSLGVGGLDADSRPTGAFVEELARGVIPQSIESLSFTLGNLRARGAKAIAAGTWPRLRRLELYGNKIYDDGAIALVQSPALATVAYLDLGDNDLTDVSGRALAESPHAGALAWIELGGALLEPATRRALATRFGDRVHFEYPWARR